MALVNELIDADFEKLPFESYPFDKYRLRYDLGTFLSELGGLNGHLLDLTPPIEIPNKRSSIRATKYLITRQVFAEFQQDTSREPISLSPAECYLPYLLNMSLSDDDLAAQVWNFADWVKRKLPLPKQTGVRLPTESEWLAMIMPLEQWTTPKLRRCNLHNGGNETPSMSAVGVFSDRQSSGDYDLIGNVWELCTPDGTTAPNKIAGRSYLDNISMLTSRNVSQITRPREDVVDFAVGFRLVIV